MHYRTQRSSCAQVGRVVADVELPNTMPDFPAAAPALVLQVRRYVLMYLEGRILYGLGKYFVRK